MEATDDKQVDYVLRKDQQMQVEANNTEHDVTAYIQVDNRENMIAEEVESNINEGSDTKLVQQVKEELKGAKEGAIIVTGEEPVETLIEKDNTRILVVESVDKDAALEESVAEEEVKQKGKEEEMAPLHVVVEPVNANAATEESVTEEEATQRVQEEEVALTPVLVEPDAAPKESLADEEVKQKGREEEEVPLYVVPDPVNSDATTEESVGEDEVKQKGEEEEPEVEANVCSDEEGKTETTVEQNELTGEGVTDLGMTHPDVEIKAKANATEEAKQVGEEATFTCEKEEDAEAIAAMIIAASAEAAIHSKFPSTGSLPELALSSSKTDTSERERSHSVSPLMKRFSKSVVQVTDNLKHVAISINEQNMAEFREFQQRRKRKEEEKVEHEAKLNAAIERGEQLGQLEKLKLEVIENRCEKANKLKRMTQRAIMIEKKKRDEQESPTSILNSSKHFLDESAESKDEEETLRYSNEPLNKVCEGEDQGMQDYERQQSEDIVPTDEMRLAKRSVLAEELRSAKEVRRHIMANFAEEREEERLAQVNEGKDASTKSNSGKFRRKKLVAGIPIFDLCKMLNCDEEDLQDSNFYESEIGPGVESIVHLTIRNLVSDMNGYDDRLSDIETMQSILLAESAASKGIDAFKIGKEGIQIADTEIDDVPLDPMEGAIMLAEQAAAQGETEFKIGAEVLAVKDVIPIIPPKEKKSFKSEFANISNRAKQRMLTFRERFEKPKLWQRRREVEIE